MTFVPSGDSVEGVAKPWFAVANGALDVSGAEGIDTGAELFVLPVRPSEPLALWGVGANLWRRLVEGHVQEIDLTDDERAIVADMEQIGIAATDEFHAARVNRIDPPWLSSPLHELVGALVQRVARDAGIRLVMIKGPALHRQGLRGREHSGDVDVWVEAGAELRLAEELERWGWTRAPLEFAPAMYHSLTMQPSSWGCEIDVHYRFPGTVGDEKGPFSYLLERCESISFGGVDVDVPEIGAHAVLHSLHLLRPNPLAEVGPSARHEAVGALKRAGDGVIDVTEKLGSLPILREYLVQAFPARHIPSTREPVPEDWQMRDAHSVAAYHRRSIRALPVRQRPRALWHAMWPSEDAARLSVARRGGVAKTALEARVKRILYGVADVLGLRRSR